MKLIANQNIDAVLCVSDGSYFFGNGVGKKGEVFGEVCFNTAMTGYQEILTDPSYAGQIINFTFPHIGNVGWNSEDLEAEKPKCSGLIIRENITEDSNYRSQGNFNEWLIKNNLSGICNIDTRALTKNIKNNGARNVIIAFAEHGQELDTEKLITKIAPLPTLDGAELSSQVSTKNFYQKQKTNFSADHNYKVVVIDYGTKDNIVNCLAGAGFDVIIVPAKSSFADIKKHNPDGVCLSNGPGDPEPVAAYTAPVIREIMNNNIPIFGICMGHQLLAIASGLSTIKMFQGHRGANHPVKNLLNNTVEITSQNHGFCVPAENIPDNIEVTHISLFDNTIEGIRRKDKLAFSVQYHPESSPGPHDSKYLFAEFIKLIDQSKKVKNV